MCEIVTSTALNKEFYYCREHKCEATTITGGCASVTIQEVKLEASVKLDIPHWSHSFASNSDYCLGCGVHCESYLSKQDCPAMFTIQSSTNGRP